MPIISLKKILLHYADKPLLDGIDLSIDKKQRLCLIGRNGCGKSSLLKVINGDLAIDSGEISSEKNLKVGFLDQEITDDIRGSIYHVIAEGLGEIGALLEKYGQLIAKMSNDCTASQLSELEQLQNKIETQGGWELQQKIDSVISKLQLPTDKNFDQLSGGLKRRVLLGRALVCEPDLLLLDEPTNHLDIGAIEWLENFLINYPNALVFISHDREFVDRVATDIVELDRGNLVQFHGKYQDYLAKKQQLLEVEDQQQHQLNKQIAKETAWSKQGVKARLKRNQGRLASLNKLRDIREQRRQRTGNVGFSMQKNTGSGKIIVEAESISFAFNDRQIIRDFSTTILRGDKIAIIGENGIGKTTLLNMLLGKLQPQQGEIKLGTQLNIAYFDQMRSQLDETKTVAENVCHGDQFVTIDGKARHITSYLKDFLFSPEQANTPLNALSGGERNRLLLARLFSQPCNFLVLDEPTNDLDIATIELLEELLINYKGSLIIVSHDRSFINNVVTSCMVFDKNAKVEEYVGGYDDTLRQIKQGDTQKVTKTKKTTAKNSKPIKQTKLSYEQQKELARLPKKIEKLEQELKEMQAQLTDPQLYQDNQNKLKTLQQQFKQIEQNLSETYARWEELEDLGN